VIALKVLRNLKIAALWLFGFTALAVKKFTEPGSVAPVLPHRALFVFC